MGSQEATSCEKSLSMVFRQVIEFKQRCPQGAIRELTKDVLLFEPQEASIFKPLKDLFKAYPIGTADSFGDLMVTVIH